MVKLRQLVGSLDAMHLKMSVARVRLGLFCQKTILNILLQTNCDDIDCRRRPTLVTQSSGIFEPCGETVLPFTFILCSDSGTTFFKVCALTSAEGCIHRTVCPLSPPSPCSSVDIWHIPGASAFSDADSSENICWR